VTEWLEVIVQVSAADVDDITQIDSMTQTVFNTLSASNMMSLMQAMGLNQLPPRIPILLGVGFEDHLLRRVARLGDGWDTPE